MKRTEVVVSQLVFALLLAVIVALQIPYLTTAYVLTHAALVVMSLFILAGALLDTKARPDLRIWNAKSFSEFFTIVFYFVFVISIYHLFAYDYMVKLHILLLIVGSVGTLVNNYRIRKLNKIKSVVVS